MPEKRVEIKKRYLILCEGIDEFYFLIYYLNCQELNSDPRFSRDIQVINFGGNQELNGFLAVLRNADQFETVENLLIIRDAETDAREAVFSICNALRRNEFPVPEAGQEWERGNGISVAYTLFPFFERNPSPGTLEDLCWELLKDDESENKKKEVADFIDHMKDTYRQIISHEHKCRLHAYLSAHDDTVSFKIGEAAKAGVFNWKHKRMEPLRELISNGFELR